MRRFGDLLSEASKFGAVGVVNLALDISVFNLLRVAVVSEKPLTAKAISMSLAATSSYFMNRHWTWRDRARTGVRREYVLFMVLSAVGLGLTETCLAISHYVLGFHSVLADNIAANGVGLVVGMVWRFWSFRQWVFLPVEPVAEATADAAHNAPV
ncbi:MAG TPA: GtrA family protein [Mycobacteriales bacterium]|nr:GtrA family protein [Mycobacteriales bacterium]